MSEEIREIILNNIDELDTILDNNYEEIIRNLLGTIFILNDENNNINNKIIQIIDKLEDYINRSNNSNNLNFIQKKLNNLIKAIKNNKVDRELLERLNYLDELISLKHKRVQLIANEKILKKIIFEDKNLLELNNLIKTSKEIFNCYDESYDILYKVLLKYVECDKKDKDNINYLYRVIVLLFTSKKIDNIDFDTKRYINLLNNEKYRNLKHVKELKNRLQEKEILNIETISKRYNINIIYPCDLEDELISYPKDYKNRYDFTKQQAITIDGGDDKCLDDALYMEKNKDGTYTLYIHIADIPCQIPYNSNIYKVAMNKGENLYLLNNSSIITSIPFTSFKAHIVMKT